MIESKEHRHNGNDYTVSEFRHDSLLVRFKDNSNGSAIIKLAKPNTRGKFKVWSGAHPSGYHVVGEYKDFDTALVAACDYVAERNAATLPKHYLRKIK